MLRETQMIFLAAGMLEQVSQEIPKHRKSIGSLLLETLFQDPIFQNCPAVVAR